MAVAPGRMLSILGMKKGGTSQILNLNNIGFTCDNNDTK